MDGLPELDLLFEKLKRGTANKIARPALSKAGQIAVRKIKAATPSRLKDIRKAVGYRIPKTKATGGIVTAKIGAAVGRRKTSKAKPRNGRKGVGISTRNVHWFFLGTQPRWSGRGKSAASMKFTGIMPKQMPSVESIVNASKQELITEMRKRIQQRLDAEIAKGPRKKR